MPRTFVIVALVASFLGIGVFLHTLFYSDAWTHRERARSDLSALQADNAAADAHVESLRSQIDAIRSRPEVQERVVRQELGFVRPDDIVVDLGH